MPHRTARAHLADELAATWPGRIDVMHRTGPRGLGLAYIDGLRRALTTGADAIGQMDADLSHDPVVPSEPGRRARRQRHGDRVPVPARRERRQLAPPPNRAERLRQSLHSRRDGPRATDCTSGYRVWRREALARLPLDTARASGYAFLTEMLYEAAAARVPDRRSRRSSSSNVRKGYSKVSQKVLFESLLTPWRLILRGGRVRRLPPDAQRHVVVMVDDVLSEVSGRRRRQLHRADREGRGRARPRGHIVAPVASARSPAAESKTASSFTSTGMRRRLAERVRLRGRPARRIRPCGGGVGGGASWPSPPGWFKAMRVAQKKRATIMHAHWVIPNGVIAALAPSRLPARRQPARVGRVRGRTARRHRTRGLARSSRGRRRSPRAATTWRSAHWGWAQIAAAIESCRTVWTPTASRRRPPIAHGAGATGSGRRAVGRSRPDGSSPRRDSTC